MNDKHDDDLLPNDPDESHYTPSYIKVSESTEILDFTLSLRTTDGGVFRFRLTPEQSSEIMAWFPFVACKQAARAKTAIANDSWPASAISKYSPGERPASPEI